MQDHAYEAMQRMQENHWWWRGMRRLYATALRRYVPTSGVPQRVIDVGCGFGANLIVLADSGKVVGVDVSLDALRSIVDRPALGLVQAEADALPFRADTFDVIALLAIVEHVDRDDRVLSETYRIATAHAHQILLTSAFMLLWSHHDEANNHRRRYLAKQLDRLTAAAGWKVIQTSYINAFLFPAVAIVRIVQKWLEAPHESKYDMGQNLGIFNGLLEMLLTFEVWLMIRLHVSLPFGVDVFSIMERP